MRILLTGSSGFIGQHLYAYFQKEKVEVQPLWLRDFDWRVKLDSNFDAIIHLAGKAHDTRNATDEDDYFKVNRDLTIQLFEEFLKSEIQDFFFFSSVKSVADTVNGVLLEDIEGNPQTPYGKSKFEAEKYLLSQKKPTGKRFFIIRPCMVHGPGNKGNLNLLYKIAEKGLPWPLAAFENRRSFMSIDNLNFIIWNMLKNKKVPSGVYNFADDESLSTNQVIGLIAEVLGYKPQSWKIPKKLIIQLAKIGDILKLPLNSERLRKLTESYVVSNQKIKSALGIDYLPLSAKEGLRLTIESLKK